MNRVAWTYTAESARRRSLLAYLAAPLVAGLAWWQLGDAVLAVVLLILFLAGAVWMHRVWSRERSYALDAAGVTLADARGSRTLAWEALRSWRTHSDVVSRGRLGGAATALNDELGETFFLRRKAFGFEVALYATPAEHGDVARALAERLPRDPTGTPAAVWFVAVPLTVLVVALGVLWAVFRA